MHKQAGLVCGKLLQALFTSRASLSKLLTAPSPYKKLHRPLWGRRLEPLPPSGSAPLRQDGAVGLDLQLRKSHDGWRGRQKPSRGRIWPWPPYCDAVEMCSLCVKALSSSHQCHTSSPPQPDVVWSVHETRDLPEALPKPPAEGKPYRKPSHLPTDFPKDISGAPTLLQEYLHWKPEFLKNTHRVGFFLPWGPAQCHAALCCSHQVGFILS